MHDSSTEMQELEELPEGQIYVELTDRHGNDVLGHAMIDKKDFDRLINRGVHGPWFLSTATNRVIAHRCDGREAPVSSLILDHHKGFKPAHKDGNPLNLTWDNLHTIRRPLMDIIH